jgi:hypothetical protein
MAAFHVAESLSFVGGFFGVEFPAAAGAGLADFWGLPDDAALCYANCRSALGALLGSVRPATLWLPAYVCRSVVDATGGGAATGGAAAGGGAATGGAAALAHGRVAVRYFAVDSSLQPDTAVLASEARAGDMVLAVDYFGRAPDVSFLEFVGARGDLLFVEDACQAFDTGVPQWGRWALRSPRKLVGVPDGGFVVGAGGILDGYRSVAEPGVDTTRPALLRFEDEDDRANALWHAANQQREAAETVSRRRMSRLSRELLLRMPVAELARRRRANFQRLAGALAECRFFPMAEPEFVPLGFPIRLPAELRERVRAALIGAGVFPALHWSDLPSPAAGFGVAHRLAAELLTLPCDHRYEPSDMERVAGVVLDCLRRA